jgi:hypothetical protein
MDYINNILNVKLDECYTKHKQLSSRLALKIEDNKNYKDLEQDVSSKNIDDNLNENNKSLNELNTDNNNLESIMIDMVKNSSKYNTISRMISIRDKIYETSIKGR